MAIIFTYKDSTVSITGTKEELKWLHKLQKPKVHEYIPGLGEYVEKTVSFWDGVSNVSYNKGRFLHSLILATGEETEFIEEPKKGLEALDLTLPDIQPRDYQIAATKAVLESNGGIIHMAVNAGKTEIIAMVCKNFTGRILVLVPTRILLKQTRDRLAKYFGQVGVCGDSKLETEARIIVGTPVSSLSYLDKIKFDMILSDECHKHTAETVQKFLKKQTQARIFGFSGTPFRKSSSQKFSDSVSLIAQGRKLNQKQLISVNTICLYGDVIAKIDTVELVKRGISSEGTCFFLSSGMDLRSDSPPDPKTQPTEWYKYWITENRVRNSQIGKICIQAYLSKQVVCVSFNHVEHLERVLATVKKSIPENEIGILTGSVRSKDRSKVIESVNAGIIKVLFVSGAFTTGVSINCLDCLINGAGMKSSFEVIQRFGRVLRKNGDRKFSYIDFSDRFNAVQLKHSRERYALLRDEFGKKPEYYEDFSDGISRLIKFWKQNN